MVTSAVRFNYFWCKENEEMRIQHRKSMLVTLATDVSKVIKGLKLESRRLATEVR